MRLKIVLSLILITLLLSSTASAATITQDPITNFIEWLKSIFNSLMPASIVDYNTPVLAPVGSGGILASMIVKPLTNDTLSVTLTGTGSGPIVAYKNGLKIGTMTITNTGAWSKYDTFRVGTGTWNFSLNDGTKVLSRMITIGAIEPAPILIPTTVPTPIPTPIATITASPTTVIPTATPPPIPTIVPTQTIPVTPKVSQTVTTIAMIVLIGSLLFLILRRKK